MSKVKNIEKRIWDREGFDVKIIKDGKDVRSDKTGLHQWPGKRQSKNGMTVGGFKEKFSEIYPGYDIEVLDSDGNPVHGATHLGTVRDTYIEDI